MSKLKTRSPSESEHSLRSVLGGELQLLSRENEQEFNVLLRVMRDGYIDRNNWEFKNIERYYKTFVGKPILCAYVGPEIGDGHNMREKMDRNGDSYFSFTDPTAERIVGVLSEDEADIQLVQDRGYTWIEAKGKLWTFYAKELVDKIKSEGRLDVSAETLVERQKVVDDVEIFEEWFGLGVTILGDRVNPAIPGANIAKLQRLETLEAEINECKLKVASMLEQEAKKPQKSSKTLNHKGVRDLNKKQREDLQAKCPGFAVIAASEDRKTVLLSASGDYFRYSFAEEETEFDPAKLVKVNSISATIMLSEDSGMEFDAMDMVEPLLAANESLSAERDVLKKQSEEYSEKIHAMQEREMRRRKQAAKDTVTATLASVNAVRAAEAQISEDVCASVLESIEKGEYLDVCNADGDWCGNAAVERDVKALCMDESTRMSAKLNESKKTVFVWQSASQREEDVTSIGQILDK